MGDVPPVVAAKEVGDVPALPGEDIPGHDDGESITSDHEFPPTPQNSSRRRKRRSAFSVPTDLTSTETQKESVSLLLLDQNLGSTETQKESVYLLDQDLGSTETQEESQSLLKREKVEESNRGKLSAKLSNEMFPWSLDLEQDNI